MSCGTEGRTRSTSPKNDGAEEEVYVATKYQLYTARRVPHVDFFIFSPNLKPRFRIFFKSSPFGLATMHGVANEQYSAMHGGGVQLPRGMQHQTPVDVYPAMTHGGLGVPRAPSWPRVTWQTPNCGRSA